MRGIDQPRVLRRGNWREPAQRAIGADAERQARAAGVMMRRHGLPRHRIDRSPRAEQRIVISLDAILHRAGMAVVTRDPPRRDIGNGERRQVGRQPVGIRHRIRIGRQDRTVVRDHAQPDLHRAPPRQPGVRLAARDAIADHRKRQRVGARRDDRRAVVRTAIEQEAKHDIGRANLRRQRIQEARQQYRLVAHRHAHRHRPVPLPGQDSTPLWSIKRQSGRVAWLISFVIADDPVRLKQADPSDINMPQ